MTIVIAGNARIRSDAREAALAAAARMREATMAEAGCVEYRFSFALDDPDVVLLHEEWADAAALDAHMATPHMAVFAGQLTALLAGPVDFSRYEVSAKRPLFESPDPDAEDVMHAASQAQTARTGRAAEAGTGPVADHVLFENQLVRVWQMALAPGERSSRHRHDLPYVMCVIEGDRIDAVQDSAGEVRIPVQPGSVLFVPPGGETEQAVNGGSRPFREILIELKHGGDGRHSVQVANLPAAPHRP